MNKEDKIEFALNLATLAYSEYEMHTEEVRRLTKEKENDAELDRSKEQDALLDAHIEQREDMNRYEQEY